MRKICSITLALLLLVSAMFVVPATTAMAVADDYFIVDFTYAGYDKATDAGKTDMYINQWWAAKPTTFEGLQGTWIRPGNNMLHSVTGGGDCDCSGQWKHVQNSAMCLANSQGQRYAIEAGKRYEIVYDLHFANYAVTEGCAVAIDAIPSTEKVYTSAVSTAVYDYVGTASADSTITGRSFTFKAAASGDIRLTPFNWASKKVWNEIYFANVKIRELPYEPASMDVDFSYSGYTHSTAGENTWYKNTWGWATNPAPIEGQEGLWMRPSNNKLHNINGDACTKGQWGPCLPNAAFRLVNSRGEAFKLEAGKKYRIKYDLYVTFGNVTTEAFGVGIDAIPADKNPASVPITKISASHWHSQPTAPRLYDDVSWEFTAETSGDARVYPYLYGWDERWMEVYFANISITELVEVGITYSGYEVSGDAPTTAYHNDTFENKLPQIEDVTWYLDAECTVPATGAIGIKDVTVYAKIAPSVGVATPAQAGLFCSGDDAANAAAGITATPGSAVYVGADGVKYTAFRVFGTYVAPDNNGTPDYGKVVVAEGDIREIKSRHVMLGYKAEPTVDNNYAMTTVSGNALSNCWSEKKNTDGSWTITYSLLLKNIPKEYTGTTFFTDSAIVTEQGVVYGGAINNVSADVIRAQAGGNLGWFDAQ